ncbi:MAG: AbrB/MazE/SpoVT family DNA-binding domain-containing protein [Bacteroidota bacterium]
MPTVQISQDFRVVIPRTVRTQLQLEPGQRLEMRLRDSHIELVPVKPMRPMRGFLKGIDTSIDHEPDRTL